MWKFKYLGAAINNCRLNSDMLIAAEFITLFFKNHFIREESFWTPRRYVKELTSHSSDKVSYNTRNYVKTVHYQTTHNSTGHFSAESTERALGLLTESHMPTFPAFHLQLWIGPLLGRSWAKPSRTHQGRSSAARICNRNAHFYEIHSKVDWNVRI